LCVVQKTREGRKWILAAGGARLRLPICPANSLRIYYIAPAWKILGAGYLAAPSSLIPPLFSFRADDPSSCGQYAAEHFVFQRAACSDRYTGKRIFGHGNRQSGFVAQCFVQPRN